MKLIRRLILCSTLIFVGADLILCAQGKNRPRISRITLRSTDVFDFEAAPYLDKFPYDAINFLHIKTDDRVIKQEFLFKVGDPLDPFLIQETERNLRALPFITAARIAQFPQRDGTVALVVYVSDAWTTEPYISIGGMNKVDTPKIGFKEKNLLGQGKQLEFSYDEKKNFERVFRYKDPRVMHSRWQFVAEEVITGNSEQKTFQLNRPFFSADTPFAVGTSYSKTDETIQEFEDNVAVSQYNMAHEVSSVGVGTKVGGGRNIVNHLGLRYAMDHSWFSRNSKTDSQRTIPDPIKFNTVFMDWSTTRNKFLKLRRIEKITRVEDYNLGPSFSISPGQSLQKLTGTTDNFNFESTYNQSFYARDRRFITSELRYTGRDLARNPVNQKFLMDGRYYHLPLPNQTLVTHTRVEWGKDLDPNNPVVVGSATGLRAYHTEQAVGNKSLVFNVEDRAYFIDELWSLFSIGGAVFYDSGYAWGQGERVDLTDMLSDVGVGLRLAMTRSSSEVILRFDVAYRLTPTNDLKNGFIVSFGSGQAF